MLRTGSLGLDILLDGGWKPGTINEIWGEPGSGKTTLAEHAIWELPRGKKAIWMSMGTEVPHRPTGALLAQPRNAEQAFTIMETCVIGDVSLIVVDSANGLVRKRELDGDPDYVPHPQREYREELNGLKRACQANGAIVLFLSKPRDRDRQPVRGTGISEKARDRVQLRIIHEKQDGTRSVQMSVKDKEPESVRVIPGTGIDWSNELVRLGVRWGLIDYMAPWYTINGNRIQGIAEASRYFEENTVEACELDELIRSTASV